MWSGVSCFGRCRMAATRLSNLASADVNAAKNAIAAKLVRVPKAEREDLEQEAFERALKTFARSSVRFPMWASGVAEKVLAEWLAKMAKAPSATDRVDERARAVSFRSSKSKRLPAGYDTTPDGHVFRGRFDAVRGVIIPGGKRRPDLWDHTRVTDEDQEAIEAVAFWVRPFFVERREGDGSVIEARPNLDLSTHHRDQLHAAHRALFGFDAADRKWIRFRSELERALEEALLEENRGEVSGGAELLASFKYKLKGRRAFPRWLAYFTDRRLLALLDAAELGRGGGRGRKGRQGLQTAVREIVDAARRKDGLPALPEDVDFF